MLHLLWNNEQNTSAKRLSFICFGLNPRNELPKEHHTPVVESSASCTISETKNYPLGKAVTQWHIYIVENKLSQYYTGICTNIARRFEEHQSSGPKCAKALKGKGPLELKFCCLVESHSEALKLEIWIKKLSKANKIKLVNNCLRNSPIQNTITNKE